MTPDCNICYQPILQAPRLCSDCGEPIKVGQPYTYCGRRGTCEPVHVSCDGVSAKGLTDGVVQGALL
jgi:hypothetical protein